MDVKKYFPFVAKPDDTNSLIIAIAVYLIASVVLGFVIGLLSWLPIVGRILSLASTLVGIYCLLGIVVSVLAYAKKL